MYNFMLYVILTFLIPWSNLYETNLDNYLLWTEYRCKQSNFGVDISFIRKVSTNYSFKVQQLSFIGKGRQCKIVQFKSRGIFGILYQKLILQAWYYFLEEWFYLQFKSSKGIKVLFDLVKGCKVVGMHLAGRGLMDAAGRSSEWEKKSLTVLAGGIVLLGGIGNCNET